ncbi:MAG: hypothetical protein ACK5S6_04350 [bacterium]|jgi:hypothetical protein
MALTKVPTNLVQQRTNSITSAATITPTADLSDVYEVTQLATSATIAAPSGTPQTNQKLLIKLRDNGTAQTLSWNAVYRVVETTLPITTTANKTHYIGCIYNTAESKWDVIAVG